MTGLANGYCYQWLETVNDGQGTIATFTSGKLVLDAVAPTAAVTAPVTAQSQRVTQATVSWTESDGGVGVAARYLQLQRMIAPGDGTCLGFDWFNSGFPSQPSGTSVSVTGLQTDSCYRWVVTVVDAAGNATSAETAAVLIDTSSPTANFTVPDEGTTTTRGAGGTTVTWVEQGGSAGIASRSVQRQTTGIVAGACGTTWTNDGTAQSPSTVSFDTYSLNASACYRWIVTLTDGDRKRWHSNLGNRQDG